LCSIDTFLRIDRATQLHYASCSDDLNLQYLEKRIIDNCRLYLASNGCIIKRCRSVFGGIAYRIADFFDLLARLLKSLINLFPCLFDRPILLTIGDQKNDSGYTYGIKKTGCFLHFFGSRG
jgi:hypothetical protein